MYIPWNFPKLSLSSLGGEKSIKVPNSTMTSYNVPSQFFKQTTLLVYIEKEKKEKRGRLTQYAE